MSTVKTSKSGSLWTAYLLALATRPLLTKSLTSATLNGLQELLATKLAGLPVANATQTALRLSLYGFCVSGPYGHYTYEWLNKLFSQLPQSGFFALLRLLVANFVITPVQTAIYLFSLALVNGADIETAKHIVRKRFLPVMKISWVVFPIVQGIAFRHLPPQLWLPFFNVVAFAFGTWTNTVGKIQQAKNNRADKKDDDKPKSKGKANA